MLKNILRSAALAAGLAIAGQGGDAQAVTVSGLYSLNGGVVTPLADADPDPERFIATQTIGNLTFISLGQVTPYNAGLLFSEGITIHCVEVVCPGVVDYLVLYVVGDGFPSGGFHSYVSRFDSNSNSLLDTEQTFLGNPGTIPPGSLATPLGSVAFPFPPGCFPCDASAVTSAIAPNGYTLTAVYDITAVGTQVSADSIAITAVPGPIVGAGLPGLIAACAGLLTLARRRRNGSGGCFSFILNTGGSLPRSRVMNARAIPAPRRADPA